MKLTTDGEVPYSKTEKKLFDLLSTKKQTTLELVESFLGDRAKDDRNILYPNAVVNITLRVLAKKVVLNGEPFRLLRSQRRGPHPISHWIEPVEEKTKRRKK